MVVAQVVAHRSTDREVQSSIPSGMGALNQWCVLSQVPATLLVFNLTRKKMEAQLCSLRRSRLNPHKMSISNGSGRRQRWHRGPVRASYPAAPGSNLDTLGFLNK